MVDELAARLQLARGGEGWKVGPGVGGWAAEAASRGQVGMGWRYVGCVRALKVGGVALRTPGVLCKVQRHASKYNSIARFHDAASRIFILSISVRWYEKCLHQVHQIAYVVPIGFGT